MESFQELKRWYLQLRETSPNCAVIVLATKADVDDDDGEILREVNTGVGKEWARQCNLTFFEVSAKSGLNIDAAFKTLTEEMW